VKFFFGEHTLDIDTRELRCGSRHIAVEPQVFDLLSYLVRNRERVVTKDDLIASVWGGGIVSDATLATRMNAARKAIGDSGEEQRLIRTLHRRGFRFVGTVRVQSGPNERMCAGELKKGGAHERPPLPDRPALAVLPFANMSEELEQEYFSDGISEDIIMALSKLRWFFVIGRNSSFAYKCKPVHTSQIAKELGVRYLVEGSVRKNGSRVRISAQLNDAVTGTQLWAERYERGLADVFAVQDEITEAVVAAIEPQVYAAESFRAQRKPPDCLDAWDLLMQALAYFWRVTQEDNIAAQGLLEKAIAIDPDYAQALAVLAISHTFGIHVGWEDRAVAVPVAERAAFAALRAGSEEPWAHLAVGAVHVYLGRYDDALAEFESALRLNPNFSLGQGYYGLVLSWVGRWKEGAEAARRALRLSPRDPLSSIYSTIAAFAELTGRNYDEAIRLARDGIRQRPDFATGYRTLISAAVLAGEMDLAKATLKALRRVQPNISLSWMTSNLLVKDKAEREHYVEAFRRAGLE
jgi:TolB-like protein